jgi:hypothetical protein
MVAGDATAALVNLFLGLSRAQTVRLVIYFCIYTIGRNLYEDNLLSGSTSALPKVGKINIPAKGFGQPPPEPDGGGGCTLLDQVNIDSVSSSVSVMDFLIMDCLY